MNHVQITRATLLAAALVAAAPSPSQAQDRRPGQLLNLLLLLRGAAPQVQAASRDPAAAGERTARAPIRPARPQVSVPAGPALLAAGPAGKPHSLPLGGDPALLIR